MNLKKIFIGGLLGILVVALAYGSYLWLFCRFYVPPGSMAVVTAKTGSTPADGAILVKRGEKGIWAEVLPEGRHFLDPVMFDVKIVPVISIPLGKVGIVTSKIGKELPDGKIIAESREEKGVWRDVLGPGTYRLNPQGYSVDIVDAINIPIGYVGVVTSQTGQATKPGQFAAHGEKGVLKDILQPGLYYINPRAYQVNVIEIGMNQVSMSGHGGSVIELKNKIESAGGALDAMQARTLHSQREQRIKEASESKLGFAVSFDSSLNRNDERSARKLNTEIALKSRKTQTTLKPPVAATAKSPIPQKSMPGTSGETIVYGVNRFVEFPSRDGFKIMLDMTVEFEMTPENISKIYMLYGDLPQVVEKIIIPQIMSISRLKGSSYKAQDFIMGEARETFQNNLKKELIEIMAEKSIIIHNAIIRNVEVPINILTPIRDSSLAKEQNLTNLSLQDTAKIEAALNTETALIEQKRKEVQQETMKMIAEINANQKKEVQKILAQTALDVAAIQLQRSEIQAKTTQLKGESEVKVNFMLENERALGAQKKAEVLGELGILSDLQFIESLNPEVKVKIIHAGEGTLWTDMKSGALSIEKGK